MFDALEYALNSQEMLRKFWNNVRINDHNECWPWLGDIITGGYGRLSVWDKETKQAHGIYAHRLAFAICNEHPQDNFVCHTCDFRSCCNPNHLFKGDHASNNKDRAQKGRTIKGEAHHKSTLTEQDIREIRSKHLNEHIKQKDLAEQYGVAKQTINQIVNFTRWAHIK